MITAIRRQLDALRVAFMVFSRIPMGRVGRVVPMGETAWAWPLVGAVLGAGFGASHAIAIWAGLGAGASVVLAIIAGLLLSGGLHEDGLADLADGIGGGANPARRLEIMRDSRLGSYGAMALILAFALSVSLWREVDPSGLGLVAVALGLVSRMALPLWSRLCPQARPKGLGQAATEGLGAGAIAVALGIGGLGAMALLSLPQALAMILACLAAQALTCLYARRVLGGITGDVLGAAQVIGSLAGLMAVVAITNV